MYCPGCSTPSAEGAKFCKVCGMNLVPVTHALSGGATVSDPLRDREYKRARKSISDGIHGIAVGAGLLAMAALCYFLLAGNTLSYVVALVSALGGIITLFRSIGHIIDAKIGPKLVDRGLQPRSTSQLPESGPAGTARIGSAGVSKKLPPEPARPPVSAAPPQAAPLKGQAQELTPRANQPQTTMTPTRVVTGRVSREGSSPLRRSEKEDDLLSKLRN